MTTKETAAATTTKQAAARQRAFAQLDATFRSGVTRPLRWRKAQLDAMARMLRQNATVIARAVRADLGKPAAETALMEIGLVLDEIRFIKPRLGRWAARHPKPMHYLLQPAVGWTVAEPKGVALIISPWNYPVLLSFEPMADAIAAGNCVCMKPSELSPHTSGVMADLIARYMDPQAFRVVQGGPQETTKLLEQPFNHIFYTGGGKVGSIVMAAAAKHLTPVTLELGGKSPVFVDRTANLDVAARRIAWGAVHQRRADLRGTRLCARNVRRHRAAGRKDRRGRHAVLRLRPATFRQFRTHHQRPAFRPADCAAARSEEPRHRTHGMRWQYQTR